MDLSTRLLVIFSSLGILDTLYLIYHNLRGTDVACFFFPKEWCQKVQYSKQSKTFGIPNAYLGFCMYVSILLLTLGIANGLAIPFWIVQAIVAFGFLFSAYFTYVQAFVLEAFCTWCVVSAINFTGLAIAAFLLS